MFSNIRAVTLGVVATAFVLSTGGLAHADDVAPVDAAATQAAVRIVTFVDKCFDVQDASPANSARIIQFTCTGGYNQDFTFDGHEIRTFAKKCLDVQDGSSANSARIIQFGCTGGTNQHFFRRDVGDGEIEIRTGYGKCLDVQNGSSANSAQIIQFTCTGAYNQRFRIR